VIPQNALGELWSEDVGDKINFIVVVSFPLDPCERTLKPKMPLGAISHHTTLHNTTQRCNLWFSQVNPQKTLVLAPYIIS